jgi:hypothetical protein
MTQPSTSAIFEVVVARIAVAAIGSDARLLRLRFDVDVDSVELQVRGDFAAASVSSDHAQLAAVAPRQLPGSPLRQADHTTRVESVRRGGLCL